VPARLIRRLGDTAGRFWAWLFSAGAELQLTAVISGLAVAIGVQLAFFPWAELAHLPPALFRPVPLLFFLQTMPPAGVVVALQTVGTGAAVLAALGWRRHRTLLLAWVPYLVLAGLRASRGKIQHNDLLLLIACVPFLLAPPTRWLHRATAERSVRWGWPVHTAVTFVAGAYFFTGLRKVLASGPAWVAGDNMRWILYAGADGKAKVPELALFIADRAWLAHLAAAGVMAFELGFPLLLLHRRARPALVAGAFAFHGVTWLTLGLDYWKYAFVVALLLVDWTPLVLRLRGAVPGWRPWSNRNPTSSTPSSA
jgi:vitamin K-dependent gamma-carboxylase-like protein